MLCLLLLLIMSVQVLRDFSMTTFLKSHSKEFVLGVIFNKIWTWWLMKSRFLNNNMDISVFCIICIWRLLWWLFGRLLRERSQTETLHSSELSQCSFSRPELFRQSPHWSPEMRKSSTFWIISYCIDTQTRFAVHCTWESSSDQAFDNRGIFHVMMPLRNISGHKNVKYSYKF